MKPVHSMSLVLGLTVLLNAPLAQAGAVADRVGNRRGAVFGNMKISAQAARSIG
jgi:hypothetical protein